MSQVMKAEQVITRSPKKNAMENTHVINLPLGLVGFPELKEMEIVFSKEELPFMRLRQLADSNRLEFVIVEPNGLIPDYKIEISDQDLIYLGIEKPEDVFVLNIATIKGENVFVNLVGPIIINRITRKAKQVVIENHSQYSEKYVLLQANE